MKIVVLAGGISTERDVSLITGTMVYRALKLKGHDAILVDVFMGLEEETGDLSGIFTEDRDWSGNIGGIREKDPDISKIRAAREDQSENMFGAHVLDVCRMADIVFMALHGSNGEDGRIQAAFDLMGIRYTGCGYVSSALSMDKGLTRKFLEMEQIPVARGMLVRKGQPIQQNAGGIGYPCIVKPCCGGSSVGVSVAGNDEEYRQALDVAFSFEDQVVVEQFIKGREFSIGVIEGKALPIIEIAPLEGFYDYKNKYQAGSTVETCPARISAGLTERMQSYAEAAYRVLGMQAYARIDFLTNEKEEIFCLEANTLPGMTPTSLLPQEAAVLGIGFEDLCEKLVEVSLAKYGKTMADFQKDGKDA